MKKFLELSKMPLIVAITAAVIYCLDALIAPNIVEGATFLWIAFVAWTVSTGMNFKDMINKLFTYTPENEHHFSILENIRNKSKRINKRRGICFKQ